MQVRGSDGSLLLDKFEFLQPENAYDGFSLFSRIVLKEFAHFYGPIPPKHIFLPVSGDLFGSHRLLRQIFLQ